MPGLTVGYWFSMMLPKMRFFIPDGVPTVGLDTGPCTVLDTGPCTVGVAEVACQLLVLRFYKLLTDITTKIRSTKLNNLILISRL